MMRSGEISGEISVNIEFLGFLWCGLGGHWRGHGKRGLWVLF